MNKSTIILLVSLVLIGLFLGEINEITGEAFWSFWKRPTTAQAAERDLITTCKDSDGIDYYQLGTVIYTYQSSITKKIKTKKYNDKCRGSTIVEYYCSDNKLATKSYKCKNGCKNGACKEEVTPVTPVPPTEEPTISVCKDSDNLNLEVKGKACIGTQCKTDYCVSNKIVMEYYLEDASCGPYTDVFGKKYECPSDYTCQDGKCIKGGVL